MHDCTVCELRWTSVFEALPLLTPLDSTMNDTHLRDAILVPYINRTDQGSVLINDNFPIRLVVSLWTAFLRRPQVLHGNAQAAPE